MGILDAAGFSAVTVLALLYWYSSSRGLSIEEGVGQLLGEILPDDENDELYEDEEQQGNILDALKELAKLLALDVAVSAALRKGTSKMAERFRRAKDAKAVVKATETAGGIEKVKGDALADVGKKLDVVEAADKPLVKGADKIDDASKVVSKIDDAADAAKVGQKIGSSADDAAKTAKALKSAQVAAKSSKATNLLKKLTGGPAQIVSFIISQILIAVLNLDPDEFETCEPGWWDVNSLPAEARVAIGAVPFLGDLLDLVGDKLCMSDKCPDGTEKVNGLCYPPCAAGFKSDGATVCWKQYPTFENNGQGHTITSITKATRIVGRIPDNGPCPAGTRDDGTSCWDDVTCKTWCDGNWDWALGGFCKTTCSGQGRIVKNLFERQYCGLGENKIGAMCYPKDDATWAMPTLGIQSHKCPAGTKDFGVGCIREAYTRGAGVIPLQIRMKPRKDGQRIIQPSVTVEAFPFWSDSSNRPEVKSLFGVIQSTLVS